MLTKTRDEWDAIMYGTDICYAPVLNFEEASLNQHNQDRATFVVQDGITQAAPAPRFSRTETQLPSSAVAPGENTEEILEGLGLSSEEIRALKDGGAVA